MFLEKPIFLPKKSLGQNFIFDKETLLKISSFFNSEESIGLVEIGPGYGSLTKIIFDLNIKNIVCIEKDEKLYRFLKNDALFSKNKKINFILSDVLEINWEKLIKENFDVNQKIILFGNLPYNISKEIIFKLIEEKSSFSEVFFLVQEEVGKQITSNENFHNKYYSYFSLLVNFFYQTKDLLIISKDKFIPKPKVNGMLISLKKRKSLYFNFYDEVEKKKFFSFIKNCFKFRRKILVNNLKMQSFSEQLIKESFDYLKIKGNSRPQELSMDSYINLFLKLKNNS